MSTDLVKRLRNTPNWMREGFQDWKDNVRTYDLAPFEAADRIEELEVKLAKAVESFIVIDAINPAGLIEGCSQSALTSLVLRMGAIARNTLEAVEGDNDE